MAFELVKARIPYRELYVPPPKRKVRDDWFSGIVQLRIERIDPTDAPVAYDVRHRDMAGDEHRYEIRIHEGLLWWPLGGDRFGLTFDRFAKLVEEGLPRSLAILDDPLGRCARELPSHAFPLPEFPEAYRRVNGELNNFHDQKARAERGASTIVICGEHVYVRAGEPIFYATAFSADDGDKCAHENSRGDCSSWPTCAASVSVRRSAPSERRPAGNRRRIRRSTRSANCDRATTRSWSPVFPGARRFAETILARLGIGSSEALAPEDDAALTALSARVL